MAALAGAGVHNAFQRVLDHGGDRGQMLKDLAADRKCVYEISGARPDGGIEAIDAEQMKSTAWDLILSCHVLEHLPAPSMYLEELRSLGKPGGVFFVEVPYEPSRTSIFNAGAVQRGWLTWLCKQPRLLKGFDFLSTGIRARLGVVPPLLFFPLREHLTFFTVQGLRSLLMRNGFTVIHAARLASGHIGAVAVKE
jgi:SAM-dependent methyltransferase